MMSDDERKETYGALAQGLERGKLHPVIDQKIPLADAERAHLEVVKPSGAHGKIVLIP